MVIHFLRVVAELGLSVQKATRAIRVTKATQVIPERRVFLALQEQLEHQVRRVIRGIPVPPVRQVQTEHRVRKG
jgi:hypothetical protein